MRKKNPKFRNNLQKNKKHKERKTSWNHRKMSEQELIDAQKKSKKDQKTRRKPEKSQKISMAEKADHPFIILFGLPNCESAHTARKKK